MKRLTCLIIGFLLLASLLSGVWMVELSASAEGVTLYFEPETVNVEPSQVFTVNVWVSNVKNLYKWTLALRWDAKVIELEPVSFSAVTEGPFLKNVGSTYFVVLPYTSGSGYLSYINCEFTQPISVSGSGILFSIRFRAKSMGEASIALENSILYDYYKQRIPHTCRRGYVSVKSVVRDVAVSLEVPSTLALGEAANLNVTVANLGTVDEQNLSLRILINNKVWRDRTLTLLKSESFEKLSFLWKPENKGAFNITAFVAPRPNEINVKNNYISLIVNVVELVRDLAISLEAPNNILLGQVVPFCVTVTNAGVYDEAKVKVSVLINDEAIRSEVIDFLKVGSQRTLILEWEPNREGRYNITAYVHPLVGESILNNNKGTKIVNVVAAVRQQKILVVSGDDGSWHQLGTSLVEFGYILSSSNYEYDVWEISKKGRPTLDLLLRYELVIWTVGDYSSKAVHRADAETLKKYLFSGGKILIEGAFLAYGSPPSYSDLWKVLHISFLGYNLETTGLAVKKIDHPITNGLPLNIAWERSSAYGPDAIKPANGAYEVISFINKDYTAVNVFDGTQEGIGSLVYYNFALKWLPQDVGKILVLNSINWLMRSDISVVAGRIINAPENTVYFVYAYSNSVTGALESSILAGSMVYAKCNSPQFQIFDTSHDFVLSSGRIDPKKINNAAFALFGAPFYNKVVRYYEIETNLTPIKVCSNLTHFALLDSFGNSITSILKSDVTSGKKDMFVIYTFTEPETGNSFLVIYGFGYMGNWAAGIYFSHVLSKNLPLYYQSYCVFKWADLNNSGTPELAEITLEYAK